MRIKPGQLIMGLALACSIRLQAAPPQLVGISISNQCPHLSIQSDVGITNQIQWSPDLSESNWTALTNLLVSQSPYEFVDTLAMIGAARFYRAIALYSAVQPTPAGMVLIRSGPFTMGNSMDPGEGDPGELPLHTVNVSAFYMDSNLVTYALWQSVNQWATNHGYSLSITAGGKATNHPAQYMFWTDAVKWCNARSEMEGKTPAYYTDPNHTAVYRTGRLALSNACVNWKGGYRLPTEAEWEKAARGGLVGKRFPWGDLITHSNANYNSSNVYGYDVSNTRLYNPAFNDGIIPYTNPVGYFAPNDSGLYDMAGNVAEWCWDYYDSYPSEPQVDPRGPDIGFSHVTRGGAWNIWAPSARTACRSHSIYSDVASFNLGFRTVLSAEQP
jgi:sulfatase modifying factor 1